MSVELPMLGIYKTPIIVTPKVLYQLTVLGPKEYIEGEEAKKFLESFKLKD